MDRYALTIDSPRTVFFDELSGNGAMNWSCVGPEVTTVFGSQPSCVTDPGNFFLLDTGVYTMEVASGTSGAVGAYSFRLVDVAPPQFCDITVGTFISDGVPLPGAGDVESVGSVDIYRLDGAAGDAVCFVDGEGSCSLRWRLLDPNGSVFFLDAAICTNDPGTFMLPLTGTYQVVVYGAESATGTYGIAVLPSRFDDLDADCHVTASDLAFLLGAWGPCGAVCAAALNAEGTATRRLSPRCSVSGVRRDLCGLARLGLAQEGIPNRSDRRVVPSWRTAWLRDRVGSAPSRG